MVEVTERNNKGKVIAPDKLRAMVNADMKFMNEEEWWR